MSIFLEKDPLFQIFTRIKDSDEGHEDLIKASKIIKRIMKRDFYKTLQTIQATEGKNDLEKLIKFSQNIIYLFKKFLGHQFHGKEIKDVQKEVQTFVAQQQNPEVKPEDILVLRSKATMGKFLFISIILV